jgi:hypothetical protein
VVVVAVAVVFVVVVVVVFVVVVVLVVWVVYWVQPLVVFSHIKQLIHLEILTLRFKVVRL